MELTTEKLTTWMTLFAQKINDNKAYLSELDTPIGDGDHGNNMARGMNAVIESLNDKNPTDLTTGLKRVAIALISKVGGAAGPLYGTAFLEMAKASKDSADLAQLLTVALAGIKKRGGAKLGDKTSECIATFFFILILLNLGDFTTGLKPLIVGLLIMVIGQTLGGTTGFALNPARDCMPRLAYSILPVPHKAAANWSYAWAPIVGPICGGILASLIHVAINS